MSTSLYPRGDFEVDEDSERPETEEEEEEEDVMNRTQHWMTKHQHWMTKHQAMKIATKKGVVRGMCGTA